MTYCFYISVCLCLVLLQTTIMPGVPLLDRFYDLLLPFIVYLGFSRNVRESLPVVFFLGFIMDNLSGGPFGLYLTTYCWLYVGVKWITQLLQIGDRLIMVALIIVAGVLAENFIFLGTFMITRPQIQFPANVFKIILFQMFWAVGTGPLFLVLIRNMHMRLEAGLNGIFSQRSRSNLN